MSGPIDPAWPMVSPGSRHPAEISEHTRLDEIREEVDRRRAAYPGFVAKGTMTREAMEREIEIFATIRDELAAEAPLVSRFNWAEKIHALRREINLRRNTYPGRIAKGKLTYEDAARRIELIEAVHWHYWMEGFSTDDPRLCTPPPSREDFPPGIVGNFEYASSVVAHHACRREFFEERDDWRAAQGLASAA